MPSGATPIFNNVGAIIGWNFGGQQYGTQQEARTAESATQNPSGQSQAGLGAAQQAVTGQTPGGGQSAASTGGAGSSYSVNPDGQASYTVTPNLIGQQTAAQRELLSLEHSGASNLSSQNAGQQQQLAIQAQQAEAQQLQQRAQIQAQAEQRRQQALGGSFAPPTVQFGSQPGAANVQSGQEDHARAASFGRAKELSGQNAQASLTALQDVMADRGMSGSTVEGNATAGILGGARGGMNDFIREQLLQDLARQAQIADQTYQGNITQRGQDLASRQSLLSLMSAPGLY